MEKTGNMTPRVKGWHPVIDSRLSENLIELISRGKRGGPPGYLDGFRVRCH